MWGAISSLVGIALCNFQTLIVNKVTDIYIFIFKSGFPVMLQLCEMKVIYKMYLQSHMMQTR